MFSISNFSKPSLSTRLLPALFAAAALSLTACSDIEEGGSVAVPPVTSAGNSVESPSGNTQDRAGIDIGLLPDGRSVQSFKSPPGYQKDAKLLTYEGPGWESDKVGYRLYLDGRNVIDIFGKKKPALILPETGRGSDYHVMADWGMDILKVGNSLGAGGWGVSKAGRAIQLGDADSYSARVISDTDAEASLEVVMTNAGECAADMTALYTIKAGARLTQIDVSGDCKRSLAAGIVIHDGTQKLSSEDSSGDWQYIARYGKQSLADDNLGMAVFYQSGDVMSQKDDNDDTYIVFKRRPSVSYMTGAAWAREAGGIKDLQAFQAWLTETQIRLNAAK